VASGKGRVLFLIYVHRIMGKKMNALKRLSGLAVVVILSACGQSADVATGNPESIAVVVDLNAVSRATGQDDVINKEMEIVNANLSKQLQAITADLNKQLATHKENFGASITVEQQQQLQELLIKANQQLELKQTEANQKSAQHKESLILDWREKIQPVVKMIANKKGADVVLVQSPLLMWFDSAIDITDEVMAELRANPVSAHAVAEKTMKDDKTINENNNENETKDKAVNLPETSDDMI